MYYKLKKCLNSRSSHQRCSIEKVVFKNFAIFTGKRLCQSLLLMNLQASRTATFLKETPTQLFSYEYCKIFKNTCFDENLRTTDSTIPPSYSSYYYISSKGLVPALNSIGMIQKSSSMFKEFSLECLVVAPLLFEKNKNQPKWSLVVTRCHSLNHSLSLVVPLVVIRCHLLSFVVARFTTGCHSMYHSM